MKLEHGENEDAGARRGENRGVRKEERVAGGMERSQIVRLRSIRR